MGEACNNGTASPGSVSVKIDISKTEFGGQYTDSCSNSIKVEKGGSLSGLSDHILLAESIRNINHNGTKQNGFPLEETNEYKKRVTVYYLDYDATNALPLIVGLTKGETVCEYYKKTSYFELSSTWSQEVRVNQESQLLPKLPEISVKVKELVVLNLTQTKGSYFADGESNRHPESNKTASIIVSPPDPIHKIYRRYKHSPGGGISVIRPLSTKVGGKNVPFEDHMIYTTPYNEACVYFWESDDSHTNPILLELTSSGKSIYYTLSDGESDKKWKNPGGITSDTLKKNLDEQNCEKNDAHVIDISKTKRSGYTCPSCNKHITVAEHNSTDYSYYTHVLSDGYIGRFKDRKTKQRGLDAVRGLKECYVLFYPKERGKPLLISYESNGDSTWYGRESFNSTNWKKLNENIPNDEKENDKILNLLLSVYAPEVTVRTEYTDQEKPYTSGDFKMSVKMDTKTVPRTGSPYYEFKHCFEDGGYFRPYEVKFNENVLHSTWLSDILTSFTVYYSSKQCEYSQLILIKLEKKDGGTDYYTEKHTEGQQLEWIKSDKPIDPEEFLMDLYAPKREKRMQKTTSISAAKAVGLASGVAVACFVVYEGTMMLFNPQRTLFAKMTGLFVRKT